MEAEWTAKRILRVSALSALFLVPLTPLVIADTFFFPFITGKAFYFRSLVEIAFVAWAALALIDRAYRPRFSWIGVAALGFLAWMFVADLLAPNALKAFWSNFERMEGWVLLVHLVAFLFAASAILRVERKWRAWFLTSLAVAVVVSVYALLQLSGSVAIHQGSTRIDATFGNSAYFAIYLLFNTFIALWLALTSEQAWMKRLLIAFAGLQAFLVFFTETRGAILGLLGASALALLLTAFTSGPRVRKAAVLALAVLVIASAGIYLARDSAFVQENRILDRMTSISLKDGQTRFTIWGMAWQGVQERPLFGWGQEGFNYVFNTYYEPSLYAQEQWFDRAHNAFIDWLSAGGIPAFLLYLSLFGSAIVLLWKSPELSRPERIALTAALAGYACHNLFVFDNLYSYIYFFAILALVDSQVGRKVERFESAPELSAEAAGTYVLPVAVVAMIVLVWALNVSGIRVAAGVIDALTPAPQGPAANLDRFEELLAGRPFAAQEIREQLVSFASTVAYSASSEADKRRAVAFAVTEMQKQVEAYPQDARERLQLAHAYRTAGDSHAALREALAAAELSPKKQQIWTQVGAIQLDLGDTRAARDSFLKAYALGPQFAELAEFAALGHIAAGDPAAADRLLIEAFGTADVNSDILAAAYYRTKNWPKLIAFWKARAERPGATAQDWFSLAAARYAAGDAAGAIATIREAVARFPEASANGASIIRQIEEGRAPAQ